MTGTDSAETRGTLVAIGGQAHLNFLYRLVMDSQPPFSHLLIFEPDPEAGEPLRARFPDGPPVDVVPAMIGPQARKATLTRYNFPGLTSLTPPTPELTHLFPGLRAVQDIPVQVRAPDMLTDALADVPRPLTLVVNMPGSEMDVLNAFEAADLIADINQIRLRCARGPGFADSPSQDALHSWLKARFLQLQGRDDSDPDWPELRYRQNHTARALAETRQALEAQTVQLEDARQKATETESALADARAELTRQDVRHSDALADLETELTRATETELTQAQNRAETLQQDLALALRMQALARADLDALREKYLESEAIRSRQETLLRQLTPRLQSAARQLRLRAPDGSDTTPADENTRPGRPRGTSRK